MKVKPSYILPILLFFSVRTFSQNWIWTKTAGGLGFREGYSVASDKAVSVFVAGAFENPGILFASPSLKYKKMLYKSGAVAEE